MVECYVPFIRFARRLLLTAVAATLTVAAGAAPVRAIGTGPGRAPLFNGSVYAIAYRLTSNILVLWPLLTPLGG